MKTYLRDLFFPVLVILGLATHGLAAPLVTMHGEEVFKAGDALTLQIPLDTSKVFNGGYPIDSAGYVDLPVVGKVYVHEKSQEQLEEYLAEKLANYLKDIHIRATPCIRITLLGHFTRQGQYYVSPNISMWEAVRAAGGMAGDQTLAKIRILRGEKELPISFLDEYSGGRSLAASGIHSGDIVVVPIPRENTGFFYVFRETVGVVAGVAQIIGVILTTYVTILLLEKQ